MVKRNGLLPGGVPQPFKPGDHVLGSGPPRRVEDRGQRGDVKPTTDAMHRGLSKAVLDLRARMRWGQMDLAEQIGKHGGRAGRMLAPSQEVISRWENASQAPSPAYRVVLGNIAAKHKHDDLAELFRAPISAWRLVGYVKLGLGDRP